MTVSFFVPGDWPTDNELLDLARKCGARNQARKALKMGPCVDDYNKAAKEWQLRVRAACKVSPAEFFSGAVDACAGTPNFLVVNVCKPSRRDDDSASLAIKYARDQIFGAWGDHRLVGHSVHVLPNAPERGIRFGLMRVSS